ncbi:MAG: hypothetical protein KBC98_02535 [Candidatus Pacebacteria bacterium]|nr:hypothetical protein [Candidatus Paceibacterota bacterium]
MKTKLISAFSLFILICTISTAQEVDNITRKETKQSLKKETNNLLAAIAKQDSATDLFLVDSAIIDQWNLLTHLYILLGPKVGGLTSQVEKMHAVESIDTILSISFSKEGFCVRTKGTVATFWGDTIVPIDFTFTNDQLIIEPVTELVAASVVFTVSNTEGNFTVKEPAGYYYCNYGKLHEGALSDFIVFVPKALVEYPIKKNGQFYQDIQKAKIQILKSLKAKLV